MVRLRRRSLPLLVKLFPIIAFHRSLADDAVLIDIGKPYAEQHAALGVKDLTLCYLYASGKSGTRNVISELPAELVRREVALGERIVATATKRPPVTEEAVEPIRQKVMEQLRKRIGPEKTNLLLEVTDLPPSRHADYCAASVALFQIIMSLRQNDAALLMRHIVSNN